MKIGTTIIIGALLISYGCDNINRIQNETSDPQKELELPSDEGTVDWLKQQKG